MEIKLGIFQNAHMRQKETKGKVAKIIIILSIVGKSHGSCTQREHKEPDKLKRNE